MTGNAAVVISVAGDAAASAQRDVDADVSLLGLGVPASGVRGRLVFLADNPHLFEAIIPAVAAQLDGCIVLVKRGRIPFEEKAFRLSECARPLAMVLWNSSDEPMSLNLGEHKEDAVSRRGGAGACCCP